MTKILICYITDDRRHFTFPHFINMLNNSLQKQNWELLILTHSNDSDFYIEKLKKLETVDEVESTPPLLQNITYNIININSNNSNNYMEKINFAILYAEEKHIPFIMKCDNDIFLKSQTLDYMINNLELLNSSNNLTLGPVITTGIPTIEYFKNNFFDMDSIEILNKLFLKTIFSNNNVADYSHLNNYTINSNNWDKEEFFNSVEKADYYYKGIHPIRLNDEANDFVNNYVIENKSRFLKNYQLKIIDNDRSPYLCNNVFCIKTDIYKNIVNDNTLFVDYFDEVPINKYCWKNNMKHLFIENGFAIHMYYNWRQNYIEYEKLFCDRFFGVADEGI